MNRYHFVTPINERAYTHLSTTDDEPFVFEADVGTNPMDMDDPEFAYREYLAERFAR